MFNEILETDLNVLDHKYTELVQYLFVRINLQPILCGGMIFILQPVKFRWSGWGVTIFNFLMCQALSLPTPSFTAVPHLPFSLPSPTNFALQS